MDDLMNLFMQVAGSMGGGGAPPAGPAPGGAGSNEAEKPQGSKASKDEKIDKILENQEQLLQVIGSMLGMGDPNAGGMPPGAAGVMPPEVSPIGSGVPDMGSVSPMPEMPMDPAAAGMAPGGQAPGMTAMASDNGRGHNKQGNSLLPKSRSDSNKASLLSKTMSNLLERGRYGGR
jgi:hypothetical protein